MIVGKPRDGVQVRKTQKTYKSFTPLHEVVSKKRKNHGLVLRIPQTGINGYLETLLKLDNIPNDNDMETFLTDKVKTQRRHIVK